MENRGLEVRSTEAILHKVTHIIENMISDWDVEFSGGIKPNTLHIADLTWESIDVVEFVVAIQEEFMQQDLPFEDLLMVDGRYVDDLCVAEVVDFLHQHLSS